MPGPMSQKRQALAVSIALSILAANANAASILDLTDKKNVDANILPMHNGGTTFADIDRSNDLYAQLLFTGEVGKYDTLQIHTDLQHRFAITQTPIPASVPTNELHVLDSIIFQGKNQSTDSIYFYSEKTAPNAPAPAPNNPYQIWMSSIQINDAHLIIGDPNPNDSLDNGLIIGGLKRLNLSDGTFEMAVTPDIAALNLTADFTITAESGDNTIKAPIFSSNAINIDIKSGGALSVIGVSQISSQARSTLTMSQGSKLNVLSSAVELNSSASLPSVIDGAEIGISGTYGQNGYSHLYLSDPKIKDSTINLDNNTYIRAFTPTLADGTISFSGNNSVNMNDGAWLSASMDQNSLYRGMITIDGGTTTFKNTVSGSPNILPELKTGSLRVRNGGHLILDGFFGGLENLSSLSVVDSAFTNLDNYNIRTNLLHFDKANITSSTTRYLSALFEIENSHYTLYNDEGKLTSAVFEGKAPGTQIQLTGTNVFDIRLSPSGQAIAPGFFNYADLYDFKNVAIQGFDTLDIHLTALNPNTTAMEYAAGGSNLDGVYEVIWLDQSTADNDNVNITLDPSMPALLQATQVATPSADQAVSIKLSTLPTSSLLTNPNITTPNQQSSLALLINSGANGNNGVQGALNTVTAGQLAKQTDTLHPELYASNMTVALEHDGMVMNTVLQNAGSFGAGSPEKNPDTSNGIWADASYVDGEVEASAGLNDFGYTLASLTIGRDIIDNPDNVLGAYIACTSQNMNLDEGVHQDFRGKAYHAGLYWHAPDLHGYKLRSVVGFSYGQNEADRKSEFAGLGGVHRSDYDSQSQYLGVKAAKEVYSNDWVKLSPELGLNYIRYHQDSLQEDGDPNLSLFIDSASAQSLVGSLGVNAQFSSLTEKSKLYPIAMLSYEHDWKADTNSMHQISAGVVNSRGYTQRFVGQNRGANAWVAGIGIGSDVSEAFQVSGGYIVSNTSNGREWGGGLNMRYAW